MHTATFAQRLNDTEASQHVSSLVLILISCRILVVILTPVVAQVAKLVRDDYIQQVHAAPFMTAVLLRMGAVT